MISEHLGSIGKSLAALAAAVDRYAPALDRAAAFASSPVGRVAAGFGRAQRPGAKKGP